LGVSQRHSVTLGDRLLKEELRLCHASGASVDSVKVEEDRVAKESGGGRDLLSLKVVGDDTGRGSDWDRRLDVG
jgi:hypothetical protein